jgi:arylsulfatase A-like enzyme
MANAVPTLASTLKSAGYATGAFGKWGVGDVIPEDDPQRKGFDEFFGYVDTSHAHNFYPTFLVHNGQREPLPNVIIPGSSNKAHEDTGVATKDGRKVWAPALIAQHVQTFLDAQSKTKPFFLYYALNLPHANNEAKQDSPLGHGLECPDYGEFATKDWPDVEKGFAQFVRFVDDQVGAVMAKLKALGMDENTLVFFSSDNGAHAEGLHDSDFFNSNGDYNGIKRSLTDGGIHTPFIARWPATMELRGVTNDTVSAFQDLLPTVADIAGVKLTAPTDGVTLRPTLRGEGLQPTHGFLYWNFDEQGGKRAVLQWPWKLIHLNTGANGKGKAKAKDKAQQLQVQLFNLDQDSGEQTNVAKDHPDIVKELEAKMRSSWQEPNEVP